MHSMIDHLDILFIASCYKISFKWYCCLEKFRAVTQSCPNVHSISSFTEHRVGSMQQMKEGQEPVKGACMQV